MKIIFSFVLILLSLNVFGQQTKIEKLEIPKTDSVHYIIEHSGYALRYSETHEQAIWVAYELTAAETSKSFERTDKFIPDPKVSTGTATNKDYEKSGYDRGHLAPAADMGWSEQAMTESFYFSNMSPQVPAFNRGIWKNLEGLVRNWAEVNGNIYIVTGPVLKPGLKTIGTNQVSVPEHYYKVVLDYTQPDIKAIGFIFPNRASKDSLSHFAVSVDSVETLTGLDFFPLLDDQEEITIEKTLCISCWNWKIIQESNNENDILDGTALPAEKPIIKEIPIEKKTAATQCSGLTKSKNRCKNHTTNASGKCHLHE